MNMLISPPSTNRYLCGVPYSFLSPLRNNNNLNLPRFHSTVTTNFSSHSLVRATHFTRATSDEVDTQTVVEELGEENKVEENSNVDNNTSTFSAPIDKELKKVGSMF